MQTYFKQKSKPKKRKRLRLKSDKKILKEQAEVLVRQIMFKRDGKKCLRCGKTSNLQMSHIYPKGRYRKMELEPENVKPLCVGCHLYWWHKNPIEADAWLEEVIPKARLDRLHQMSLDNSKDIDIKFRILWLQQELKNYV